MNTASPSRPRASAQWNIGNGTTLTAANQSTAYAAPRDCPVFITVTGGIVSGGQISPG